MPKLWISSIVLWVTRGLSYLSPKTLKYLNRSHTMAWIKPSKYGLNMCLVLTNILFFVLVILFFVLTNILHFAFVPYNMYVIFIFVLMLLVLEGLKSNILRITRSNFNMNKFYMDKQNNQNQKQNFVYL